MLPGCCAAQGCGTGNENARSAGFEPARAGPTGFQVQPRDHLGTIAHKSTELKQPWSSGMMEPSQGFDPGSIPGGCIFSASANCAFRLNTPAWIRTRVARFKVWSANHYTTGAGIGLRMRVRSSVVEHSAAVRMVPGSNPGVPSLLRGRKFSHADSNRGRRIQSPEC